MKQSQNGFTIVELLIATLVFSSVMMVVVSGIAQIGRLYYKGVTMSRTQETTQRISDEITQSIQFGSDPVFANASMGSDTGSGDSISATGYFCAGGKRYEYKTNRMLKPLTASENVSNETNNWALRVYDVVGPNNGTDGCPLIASSSAREMLSENMRLLKARITPVVGTSNLLWKVDIWVAFGDKDFLGPLTPAGAEGARSCTASSLGTQFCALMQYSVTVQRRVQ